MNNKSNKDSSVTTTTDTPDEQINLRSMRLPFAVVIVLTLFSGVVHGVMDGRWTRSEDFVEQGKKLSELSGSFADWTLLETKQLESEVSDLLRCYGSEVRVYRHNLTQETVTAAVLLGPRGPIAVHRPEICYRSIGTTQIGDRQVETVRSASSKHQFWTVQFAEKPSTEPSLEVWYGWSTGKEWVAAENPRFWLTNNLYKIQVASSAGNEKFNPCQQFLRDVLPELQSLIR